MGCYKGASWVTTAEGNQGEWEERTVISQKCPGPLPISRHEPVAEPEPTDRRVEQVLEVNTL